MRTLTYQKAAAEAIMQAMEQDDRVFLIGEGVDNITGVYGHVLPAYKKFGPKRVIDSPLSENGLTGFCVGAALDGLRPVLIHQRNDFMLLSMDQMMNQAAKLRYVSDGKHSVPMTVLSFVARKLGEGAQHSQSLQAVLSSFPGIKLCMPGSAYDVKGMIMAAIAEEEPTIILEHRSLFADSGQVPVEPYKTPQKARIVLTGSDLTIVGMSVDLVAIHDAALESKRRGVSVEVIDVRWLRPLDVDTIVESVEKTGRLLIVDSSWQMYGVSSEIITSVCERGVDCFKTPPQRIGLPDVPCPASQYHVKHYYPGARQIEHVALDMMETR